MKMEIRGDLTALTSGAGRQRLLDTIQKMLSPIDSFSITMTYSEKKSGTSSVSEEMKQTEEEERTEKSQRSPSITEQSLRDFALSDVRGSPGVWSSTTTLEEYK